MGAYLLKKLKEQLLSHPMAGDIRGLGIFAGVELVEDRATKTPVSEQVMGKVAANAASPGVLIGRTNKSVPGGNNTVILAPTLVVTREQVDRMATTIRDVLDELQT